MTLNEHGRFDRSQALRTLVWAVLIFIAFFVGGAAMSAEGYTIYFPLLSRAPTLTATPTPTLTLTPTDTRRPPPPPSETPVPTSTSTPVPTVTRTQSPVPTASRTPTPTATMP